MNESITKVIQILSFKSLIYQCWKYKQI